MDKGYLIPILAIAFVILAAFAVNKIYNNGITGRAVREIAPVDTSNVVEDTQKLAEPVVEQTVESTGVCDGFGFVRKKTLADGSQQEYCYDPCNGNQECIANFNNIEEIDFVGPGAAQGSTVAASQPPSPPGDFGTSGGTGTAGETDTSAGGGSSDRKKII